MLTGCKDTLFFAFMQAGVPKNRQRAAKIPTLHIEIPNLDIGRGGNMHTFSQFFFVQNGESFAEVEVVEIIPERV